jgi:molybdopterin converting factor subunit 1
VIAQVRLFAIARQLAGRDVLEIELDDATSTVAKLREQLAAKCPPLAPLIPHLMIAIDSRYANNSDIIMPGVEIACIPPVSGG